jgi:hypothetical protein
MYFTSEQIDERLQFFSELMSYNAPCFLWTYSPEGDLLSTNCPKTVLNRFFQNCGCYQYMMEHSKVSKSPLLMSGAMGLLWGAVFEHQNDQLERIHVLGPVHTQTIDNVNLEQVIWGKIDVRWKPKYKKIMEMRQEFDPEKRIKLCYEMGRILHEEQPYTFMFYPDDLMIISNDFGNVKLFPAGVCPQSFTRKEKK